MKMLQSKIAIYLFFPLLIAGAFSGFIYWEHFGLTSRAVNTFAALGALYGLLHAPKRSLPITGFWIGIAWCYWIGFSFQYYDLGWATWLVSIGFGFVYALFFGVLALTSNSFLRALLLFGLSFVWPMDFNWVQPELIFVESYIGLHKWQFAAVLGILALLPHLPAKAAWTAPLLLFIAFERPATPPPLPPLKIKLVSTDIPQDMKWQAIMLDDTITNNMNAIYDAYAEGYDLVVLPELAFPLYINRHPWLIQYLKTVSYYIPVLTGTLRLEGRNHYNVTYFFENGHVYYAKKTVLVPFGQYIPLPSFMRGWINREIFGGGSDFVTAKRPTDYTIQGVPFRNAICYEATREELYASKPRYMIAVSNNGWFKPSIEPTLQKLLIRFYARKNNTVVFHSANGGGSGIIR